MPRIKSVPAYIRHLHWYVRGASQIPLCTDFGQGRSLPDLESVVIRWPQSYMWPPGGWRLDLVKDELARLVPVQPTQFDDLSFDFRRHQGFPLPDENAADIGKPGQPKGPYDIRGELFEVRRGGRSVLCAYDYSDYSTISTLVLDRVALYFKCLAPPGALPPKVVPAGYFPRKAKILAKARRAIFCDPPRRTIDVYARFGSWTDGQGFRSRLVSTLGASNLNFIGGFGTRVYPAYLKELMIAKIAIDAPGQGPLSYRLVEAMALGAVPVCVPPLCSFPQELVDGVHYASLCPTGANVVEVCHELLNNEERRREIARNGMGFFDHNFSPQSIARRILACAIEKLV